MVTVANLRRDHRFQIPGHEHWSASRILVRANKPSLTHPDKRLLDVKFKNGKGPQRSILLPTDLKVALLHPDGSLVALPAPQRTCTCRNHMGGKKQLYKTKELAMEAILTRHLEHGGHSIYPCPAKLGFHVRSQKMRLAT